MKIKQHKAPDGLKDKIDSKILFYEGVRDIGELFFKNSPKSLIDFLSSKKDTKK